MRSRKSRLRDRVLVKLKALSLFLHFTFYTRKKQKKTSHLKISHLINHSTHIIHDLLGIRLQRTTESTANDAAAAAAAASDLKEILRNLEETKLQFLRIPSPPHLRYRWTPS